LTDLYALAAECRATTDADIGVDLHAGPVSDVLEGYAKRHGFDLIVMSSHGRSGISRLTLGSVTDSLIRHTTIPVLVVKPSPSYLDPRVSEPFRRILVPLDGSALAEQILPRAVNLAKLVGAEITLLHVLASQAFAQKTIVDGSPSWSEKTIARAEKYLFDIAARIRANDIPTMTDIVISDSVSDAISDFATRQNVSLIAIATHGRGGVARMLRGSVADALLHSAPVCMLVLKPQVTEDAVASTIAVHAELIPV
jgi:nucleotide-binding universal stress UspA family protein